jgi:hypothetical protein
MVEILIKIVNIQFCNVRLAVVDMSTVNTHTDRQREINGRPKNEKY